MHEVFIVICYIFVYTVLCKWIDQICCFSR